MRFCSKKAKKHSTQRTRRIRKGRRDLLALRAGFFGRKHVPLIVGMGGLRSAHPPYNLKGPRHKKIKTHPAAKNNMITS
jgi:hypothetical protein